MVQDEGVELVEDLAEDKGVGDERLVLVKNGCAWLSCMGSQV